MKLIAIKCPNCGAQVDFDKEKNMCICNYCNSKIFFDDEVLKYRVELNGKIELKNAPKLESYLKLGRRYYKNGEYMEAYKVYTQAMEYDADNLEAMFRRELCQILMNSDDFNITGIINLIDEISDTSNYNNETIKYINELYIAIGNIQESIILKCKTCVLTNEQAYSASDMLHKIILCYEKIYNFSLKLKCSDDFKLNIINDILYIVNYKLSVGKSIRLNKAHYYEIRKVYIQEKSKIVPLSKEEIKRNAKIEKNKRIKTKVIIILAVSIYVMFFLIALIES